jgi:NAD(P)-dependent dehydrogenase (short-subunit alcohol dehydrogenase family)
MASARRIVLITGCSSPHGIGRATARALAQRGHAVHATVRDHSTDDSLRSGVEDNLAIHHLDLLKQETIEAAVAEVLETDGGIDVLINNAGYGLIGGVEQVGIDQARAVFETDVFGTLTLTQAVLPSMRHRRRGHVIMLSSVFVAGLCLPALGYYVGAKAALESAAQSLAVEVAPFGIRVTNVQPGPVLTELERQWGNRLSDSEDPRPGLSDELYRWVLSGGGPKAQSPEEVAEALCDLVECEAPPLAVQTSPPARDYVATALVDPSRMTELSPLLEAFNASSTSPAPPG